MSCIVLVSIRKFLKQKITVIHLSTDDLLLLVTSNLIIAIKIEFSIGFIIYQRYTGVISR